MLNFDQAPKRATNLSLNSAILDLAKEMGLNVSQTVDRLLAEEVRRRYKAHWEQRNRAAIEAYNERIEREGTLGEQVQRWLSDPSG
ncbi:type II toxin-antitoxin system CcdA family antitoxin [Caldimonas sp.]|uniref:type II toxin-antitoxin system CcdA family antitoxin n=1 Tax=Caldimonas sp. TaxID=2838790 RepID=UPI0039197B8F